MKSIFVFLILSVILATANSLRVNSFTTLTRLSSSLNNKATASIAVSLGLLLGGPLQNAGAAVGEGDLPEGAIAFQKVLKYQRDWKILTDSIKPRVNEIDDKEITSIKLVLKQLANEYYDLELLSKSITDPDKAATALTLAKDFRSQMRANDDAASLGEIQKVIDSYPATAKDLSDFLELMNDVPDEL